MTGHKLVRFSAPGARTRRFVDAGGLLFSDDCNHDVNGLYAKSFEQEMSVAFPGDRSRSSRLAPDLPFFTFPAGPPQTAHELNGWGDDLVHDYLHGIERADASACSTRKGLRLRVGLRLAKQAIPPRGQHQIRRQHRRLRDGVSMIDVRAAALSRSASLVLRRRSGGARRSSRVGPTSNAAQIRALDRSKTVVLLTGGMLEEHGPYLPGLHRRRS